jgi:hypothetical protein
MTARRPWRERPPSVLATLPDVKPAGTVRLADGREGTAVAMDEIDPLGRPAGPRDLLPDSCAPGLTLTLGQPWSIRGINENGKTPALSATVLRKSYGDKVVLDGIDLNVAEGTIFSLLGPNGAGKTTTVQILSTLITADGGDVQVTGHDLKRNPNAVRAAIGVTGQFSAVDNLLTGQENLLLMADLHHLDRREGRRRLAAGTVRPGRGGGEDGDDLLRRHAPAARHRDDADGPPAGPALHLGQRDPAGTAHGGADRAQRSGPAAWCVAIAVMGYLWVKKLFNRDPGR